MKIKKFNFEFFGLPSVGKTTLASALAKAELGPIITVNYQLERLLYPFLFLLTHPIVFFRFYFLSLKESGDNRKLFKHKRHLFLLALAKETKATWSLGGIIDDGLYQFLLSVYEKKITQTEAEKILSWLDNKRKIVIVETPNQIRGERLLARGRIPRKFLGEAYLINWSKVLEHNYQIFKKILIESRDCQVINNQ